MVKTRKKLSVVFLVMSRNSVAFFWKSSPPAHRGETKAQDYHSPGYSDFFWVFFFRFLFPQSVFSPFPIEGASAEENLEIHGSTDCVTHYTAHMHRKETNMNSLIPMLASEETRTSEHVSCLSPPSFLADVILQ